MVRRACWAHMRSRVSLNAWNLGVGQGRDRGSLRRTGCQLSSRLCLRPCHKGIRWKAIEQDTGQPPLASMCV